MFVKASVVTAATGAVEAFVLELLIDVVDALGFDESFAVLGESAGAVDAFDVAAFDAGDVRSRFGVTAPLVSGSLCAERAARL